jgi:hypothetical protein
VDVDKYIILCSQFRANDQQKSVLSFYHTVQNQQMMSASP